VRPSRQRIHGSGQAEQACYRKRLRKRHRYPYHRALLADSCPLLTGRNHHRVHSGAMAERAVDWDGYTGVIGEETAAIGQVLPALAADVGSRLFDPSKLCQYLVCLEILATEPTKLHTSGVTPRKVHRAKLPPLSSSSVGFLTHSCPAARAASSQHACTSGRTVSGLATQFTRAAGSLVFRHPRVCRGGGQRG
jgi:hypothetical protein